MVASMPTTRRLLPDQRQRPPMTLPPTRKPSDERCLPLTECLSSNSFSAGVLRRATNRQHGLPHGGEWCPLERGASRSQHDALVAAAQLYTHEPDGVVHRHVPQQRHVSVVFWGSCTRREAASDRWID